MGSWLWSAYCCRIAVEFHTILSLTWPWQRERERQRDRDRQTDRQRERVRERERASERASERESERDRDREHNLVSLGNTLSTRLPESISYILRFLWSFLDFCLVFLPNSLTENTYPSPPSDQPFAAKPAMVNQFFSGFLPISLTNVCWLGTFKYE